MDSALHVSVSSEGVLKQLPAATWTVDTRLRLTAFNGGSLVPPELARAIRPGGSIRLIAHAFGIDASALAAYSRALAGSETSLLVSVAGRDFKVSLSPLLGGDGAVVGVVGLALEVTQDAREAERLRHEAAFGGAVSDFLGHVVRRRLEGDFYERALQAVLKVAPGARGAALWLRSDDGLYRVVAGVGAAPHASLEGALTGAYLDLAAGLGGEPHDPAATPTAIAMCVPVVVDGATSSYLCLYGAGDGTAFDERARRYVQLFAIELAALFEHVDMQRTLRDKRAKLERLGSEYKALAEFSAGIEGLDDIAELIEFGLQHLLEVFRFDTAMFTEVRGGELHFTHLRGVTTPALTATLEAPQPVGAGINGRVAATGEPLYVDDYPAWPSHHAPYLATGVRSMLALPVRIGGRVTHTLAFATLDRRAALDDNAVRIAGTFVKRLENAFERVQHLDEIKATREATFRALGVALEHRDLETHGHTDRVVALSRRFAAAMDLDAEEQRALVWGAYLHDLGKLAVPDAILLKPGRLTEDEFAVIRRHTLFGAEMLRDIPFLPSGTRQVVLSHHERWDGTGYPERLRGEAIPLLARMFSLVDVYDALTSERPYKRAWSPDEAVRELERQAGAQFEAALVPHFLRTVTATEP